MPFSKETVDVVRARCKAIVHERAVTLTREEAVGFDIEAYQEEVIAQLMVEFRHKMDEDE
jgi:hypothetical protein